MRSSSVEKHSIGLESEHRYLNLALLLAIVTVVYNIGEGAVATYLGFADETIALFGFGVDSFIEVISGIGIVHYVIRVKHDRSAVRDDFERLALRITGTAFFLLTAGLVGTAIYGTMSGSRPETTFWGIVISVVSIVAMSLLIKAKLVVGYNLGSDAIIADAKCTRVCVLMSTVLLFSSLIFAVTGIGFADMLGAIGISYLSFREGRECFEKASGKGHCGCDDD